MKRWILPTSYSIVWLTLDVIIIYLDYPRKMVTRHLLICVCVVVGLLSDVSESCDTSQAVYSLPGDITISSIFNGHSGFNCSTPVSKGLHQMSAAVYAMRVFRNINYIPGVHLGLAIHDACSSSEIAHKAMVTAMVEIECRESISLGVLTTPKIYRSLSPMIDSLSIPVTVTSDPMEAEFMSDLAVTLLITLDWTIIDTLIVSDQQVLDAFKETASSQLLCIKNELFFADIENTIEGIIVIITSGGKRKPIGIDPTARVLYITLDEEFDIQSDQLPSETYTIQSAVLHKSVTDILISEQLLEEEEEEEETAANGTTMRSNTFLTNSIKGPTFVQMSADYLQILNSFKTSIVSNCPELLMCDNLPTFNKQVTTKNILKNPPLVKFVLNTLKLTEYNEEFEGFTVGKLNKSGNGFYQVGSFKIVDDKWSLIFNELNGTSSSAGLYCRKIPDDNTTGIDCEACSNYDNIYRIYFDDVLSKESLKNIIEFRSESWVAAVVSISTVGVLCCIAIAIFILVRVCKGDILEGNPCFSFLLILAIIFTYCSILPFSFEITDKHHYYESIMCVLQIFGTSLSYALVFSIMLARALMLASCDQDGGFMSHVNGYLQTFLCFFISIVQIALSVQFWAINWKFLSKEQCQSMTEGYLFISLLGYDMFLLLLLVCTSPFIVRSKRNYREGAFFATASMLCLLVWAGWCSAYVLLPRQWNDTAIACGLSGTATIVLVTVFIPRTYLMMTGIVRDHITSALPSLAYTAATSTSVVDVNYRSTQSLYDSVNPIATSVGVGGHSNPNFYSDRPNTPSTSKMDSQPRLGSSPDNSYERYGSPPSPLNITRF